MSPRLQEHKAECGQKDQHRAKTGRDPRIFGRAHHPLQSRKHAFIEFAARHSKLFRAPQQTNQRDCNQNLGND